ncbi:hypothetical protein Mal64_00150 [Pseudobythopirellula maris]|uniref:DUF6690 domain-containing protein n=1 Tax=Pseudobythopirellula maris TaxID=2527991 RepID=A0A5C5ZRG1_9BACT|nr:DUF6690 family protein [Pseudobythopirellula maris]TWT89638.1 hypothetical protein Mal64_00150 [Pseudobythopirellula maris]
MLLRPTAMIGVLGAAVAAPYVITQSPETVEHFWPAAGAPAEVAPAPTHDAPTLDPATLAAPSIDMTAGPGEHIYRSAAPIEGSPHYRLVDVLRLDITREWVYQHWARKSTGLAELDLFGVRVPLVTGAGMTDLAGSLSYYFDNQGLLQKIRFHGRTADTTQLVGLFTQHYGLVRQASQLPGEQLYQRMSKKRVESELRSRPESVLWSTTPHESFVVDFELNRPGGGRFVEPPKPQLMIPQAAGAPAPQAADPAATPEAEPVFPSRTFVQDAPPKPPEPAAARAASEAPAAAPATQAPVHVARPWDRWPN